VRDFGAAEDSGSPTSTGATPVIVHHFDYHRISIAVLANQAVKHAVVPDLSLIGEGGRTARVPNS